MVGGRWKTRDQIQEEARKRVVRSILNGSLKVRYIERGSDPYKPNGGSSMVVGRTPDEMSWAERTLQEAHQQKPRLQEIIEQANAELTAIDKVIAALEDIEETGGITTPLVAPTAPPPAPKPQFKALADVSDDEIVAAVKLLGGATGGWVSSGPVKRELKLKDDASISPRMTALVEGKALRKKGVGAGTMYRVREEKPAEEKKAPSPAPEPKQEETRTLQHPGIDAVPEHLREMPAAGKNFPLKSRIAAAEGQLKVYNYVVENGPSVGPEVSEGLKMSRGNVKRYLDDLTEAGLLERTDNWRRAHGQTAGRTAVEFQVPGGQPEALPKEEQEESEEESVSYPEPEPTPEPPVERPTLEEVRDATAKMPDIFSVAKLVTENADKEWKFDATRQRLDQLAERGILEKAELVEGDPNMVTYSYVEATEPGAAAMIDQARRAEEATHGGEGALAVAGTGKQKFPSNKEAAETVKAARASGCEVIPVAQGHWAVLTPEGRRILISGSPSSGKSVEADRKKLRRIGVNV